MQLESGEVVKIGLAMRKQLLEQVQTMQVSDMRDLKEAIPQLIGIWVIGH